MITRGAGRFQTRSNWPTFGQADPLPAPAFLFLCVVAGQGRQLWGIGLVAERRLFLKTGFSPHWHPPARPILPPHVFLQRETNHDRTPTHDT